jgi:hypothetical protein
VHVRVVDLMSGTAGELLLYPGCTPWVAHSDIQQARALAGLICTSEATITAYLEFGAEEAKALILLPARRYWPIPVKSGWQRLLLLLVNFGREGSPQPIVPNISQETLPK